MVRRQKKAARRQGYAILPTVLSLGLTAALTAQTPVPLGPVTPPAGPPPAGPAPAPTKGPVSPGAGERPVLLDSVMMTVDNKVILASEVEDEFRAQVKLAQQRGETIDTRTKAQLFQQARLGFLRAAVRAQSAWTIPGSTPDQIQKIVDSELKKRQQREIDDFGSLNKMKQEMGIMGHNHFIVERRKREQILTELAQQDFARRFRDRLSLMITPKHLRAHYAKRRAELKAPARSDVSLVRFVGDGTDVAALRTRAEKAATAWRNGDRTSADLAKEFAGSALPDQLGVEAASGKLLPFIQKFVATARGGKVSAPIPFGNSFYVLKITRWQGPVEFAWNDPAVQTKLREELVTEEYNRILLRLGKDREKSLKIWPAPRSR